MSFLSRLFKGSEDPKTDEGPEELEAAVEETTLEIEAEMPSAPTPPRAPAQPMPTSTPTPAPTPAPAQPVLVPGIAAAIPAPAPQTAAIPAPAPQAAARPPAPAAPKAPVKPAPAPTLPLPVVKAPEARAPRAPAPAVPARPNAATQPRPASRAPQAATDDTGRLWPDLESTLDAAIAPKEPVAPSPAHGVSTKEDLAAARRVFEDLARSYMGQVRNLMLEVKWGQARAEWLSLCDAVLRSLRRMAETMEMPELCAALDGFHTALRQVRNRCNGPVVGAERDTLLEAYGPLLQSMPQVFELDAERNRREPIIVDSLLRQVPEVEKVTIDRIYAAGLTSLEVLGRAKPDEIAATTSIAVELATRIVELFKGYRQGNGATVGAAAPADEYRQLAALIAELRRQHAAFEEAASAWSESARARKKELRRARAATTLKIQVALARVGEVDRVGELEKLPFRRKIEQVERYLEQARTALAASPERKAPVEPTIWQV